MATFMDNHEAYQKYKDDPLVVMLLSYFRNSKGLSIPDVWKSFIMKSDANTDINLLLSQLANWGITEQIDTSLRGVELLDNIMASRLRARFAEADDIARTKKIRWSLALERAFIAKGYVPSEEKREMVSSGYTMMNTNLSFVETGTVRYKVRRTIPEVFLNIPPEWILENCNPDISDAEIMNRFRTYLNNGFCPPDIKRRGGFEFRAWLKRVLFGNNASRFNPTGLTSSLQGFFPRQIQGTRFDDEPMFYMDLHDHRPDPIQEDEQVNRREINFGFRTDRRGGPRETFLKFPVFNQEQKIHWDRKGLRVPRVQSKYFGAPGAYYADPHSEMGVENMAGVVGAFRSIYEEIALASEYTRLRKEAVGK